MLLDVRPVGSWPRKTFALDIIQFCDGRWFALDELPELVPPHERAVLDLLAGQLDGGRPVPAITTFGFAPGERVAAYGVARPH